MRSQAFVVQFMLIPDITLEYNLLCLHPTNFTFSSKDVFSFKLDTSAENMFMYPLIKLHSLPSSTFRPRFRPCPLPQVYINTNLQCSVPFNCCSNFLSFFSFFIFSRRSHSLSNPSAPPHFFHANSST